MGQRKDSLEGEYFFQGKPQLNLDHNLSEIKEEFDDI